MYLGNKSRKATTKKTNDGTNVAVPSTQTPISLIGIRLKIVTHEKFEAVPQLTRGQKPYESVHRLSRISANTNKIHILYLCYCLEI